VGNSAESCAYEAKFRSARWPLILLILISCFLIAPRPASAQPAVPDPCPGGFLSEHDKADPPDLLISKICSVKAGGKYFYGNVNIIQGGLLAFEEPKDGALTDFWARSIIVENGGVLRAAEYGQYGGILTIHLYGQDLSEGDPSGNPGMGAPCRTSENEKTGPCGIPMIAWLDNGKSELVLPGRADPVGGTITDYFYRYGPLHGDEKCSDGRKWGPKQRCDERSNPNVPSDVKVGYFGYKVLAVSYGGVINLEGRVGNCREDNGKPLQWINCLNTWGRLDSPIAKGQTVFEVDESSPNQFLWISKGDEIVITTTDYLPGHSETFIVTEVERRPGHETVLVDHPAEFPHNGTRYSLLDRLKAAQGRLASIDSKLVQDGAETRAAVAILNRSIRIISGGDSPGENFPDSPSKDGTKCQLNSEGKTDGKGPCYSFGGHMVIRQGFAVARFEGVEFKQMGQGGRLGHYPIHFHMARNVPVDASIARDSINESMTRWVVLHSTSGVRVEDNVGYKSIGHGFYLEDATETGNEITDNLGIFARAAIDNDQNPRKIPGILSDNQADPDAIRGFPYRSDSEYPSVFWITNGWNDFKGNMAAGAGTCGTCYWLVPAANSSMADVPDENGKQDMTWSGYAALQKNLVFAGSTPLKSFEGNFCTSAMMSFQTTPDATQCAGTIPADGQTSHNFPTVRDLKGLAPPPASDKMTDMYYPHIVGARRPTLCPQEGLPYQHMYNCNNVQVCPEGNAASCAVTVLDHFTSSFNWAAGAVSAVWLRPQWYLVDNSVLTDVQNAALTFVSGGDFTHASIIPGYWALVRNSIFVGHTQTGNGYAQDSGPFNKVSGLKCDPLVIGQGAPGYCLSTDEGISLPVTNWFVNQRLFSIYDGPAFEDTNAYLDIKTTDCDQGYNNGCIYGSGVAGVPKDPDTSRCYLPNAAIAWKQPNGFFYPPAFHSKNLFFDNVDIRHYVIDPLFEQNTYKTDSQEIGKVYCGENLPNDIFNGFSGIDRQTELNDDDGSLTGLSNTLSGHLKQTISVNEDAFFNAPAEAAECWSNIGSNNNPKNACELRKDKQPPVTAKTSPYDYVSTVIYHSLMIDGGKQIWSVDCSNPRCYGVPLFRQYLTGQDMGRDSGKSTREWAKWYKDDPKTGENCDKNPNTVTCRWPFIRMAGTATATRGTMTVDGAAYYIDTTVPWAMQAEEDFNQQRKGAEFFNVFLHDQTYTVFFLYLKPETHQTYQIYVGKGFDFPKALEAVQVKIPDASFKISALPKFPGWLNPVFDKETGILTLNVSFDSASSLLKPTPANGLCQPSEFCKADGDRCVGNVAENDPRFSIPEGFGYGPREANAICSQWAVKDLDCPPSGCLGFQFTLPSTFVADATASAPSPHRPRPQPFPASTTEFTRTLDEPDKSSGACYYPKVPTASNPGSDQCLVP
jgi:cell migration-inducing and hyaluronan-binding protein